MLHKPALKFWSILNMKCLMIRVPKSRSEPDLNQMSGETWSDWSSSEPWMIFHLLCFTNMLFKIITNDVELKKWKALLIWFLIVNRVWVWINRSGSSINHSLSWTCLSLLFAPSAMFMWHDQYNYWLSSLVLWQIKMFTNKISIFPFRRTPLSKSSIIHLLNIFMR